MGPDIHHPLEGDIAQFAGWAAAPPERPGPAQLITYGAVSFLATRDRFARRLTNNALRAWFEPAVLSGQFTILYDKETPRAMMTWAHLTPDDGERFIRTRQPPPLEAWFKGRRLWIMSVLSPYNGPTRQCLSWIEANTKADQFSALRFAADGRCAVCRYRREGAGFQKSKQFV